MEGTGLGVQEEAQDETQAEDPHFLLDPGQDWGYLCHLPRHLGWAIPIGLMMVLVVAVVVLLGVAM